MSETPIPSHVTELIEAYMDDSLTPQEAQELLQILRTAPEVANTLLNELRDNMLIHEVVWATEQAATLNALSSSCVDESSESETKAPVSATDEKRIAEIQQYAQKQLRLFLSEQKQLQTLQARHEEKHRLDLSINFKGIGQKIDHFLTRTYQTLIWGAIATSVLLATLIGYQVMFPNIIVARLAHQNHAAWNHPIDGNDLAIGWYQLNRGFAQLNFKKGAQVLLQAPCQFKLLSATSMHVESGALSIQLAQSQKGFTVETPTMQVVDLGTEFGIHVGGSQHSEIHVFDGKVAVGSNQSSKKEPLTTVPAGKAAWTNTQGQLDVGRISDRPSLFIRTINNTQVTGIPGIRLDLADIVGGGNGYGTGINQRNYMNDPQGTINTLTGKRNDPWRPDERFKRESEHYVATMSFNPNFDCPYIDGTFLPDGSQGTCVISTAGHVFKECPDTDAQVFVNIMNGWLYAYDKNNIYTTPELNRTPGLFMHANSGIIFDLQKIRASLSGIEIQSFSTQAWIPSLGRKNFIAEIWILLDGQVQVQEHLVMSDDKLDIHIPIPPETQFLTLVTTDAQDTIGSHPSNNDQCHFLHPYLILDNPVKHSILPK